MFKSMETAWKAGYEEFLLEVAHYCGTTFESVDKLKYFEAIAENRGFIYIYFRNLCDFLKVFLPLGVPANNNQYNTFPDVREMVLKGEDILFNCGGYSFALGWIAKNIFGFKARRVRMQTINGIDHIAIEIEILGEWAFFDPLYGFCHFRNDRVVSLSALYNILPTVQMWNDMDCTYPYKHECGLHELFYHTSVENS